MTADAGRAPAVIHGCQPGFTVDDGAAAREHYVDWLGFNLDWEWRAAPGEPVIMSVSRDALALFLGEAGDQPKHTLRVRVETLETLVAEWNGRRPGAVEVTLEQPYEIPTVYLPDPFGNQLIFGEIETDAVMAKRAADAQRVRDWLEARGGPAPEAAEIVAATDASLGVTLDVLNDRA